ncbi:hypothetical protein HMPREF0662_02630 [Prevotella nigrescens F0103]|nr:hypothetical protein HMPREF0662_02630 [Prevotella nigrescens F0103]
MPTAKLIGTNSYPYTLLYRSRNSIKNFSKYIYRVTSSLSTHHKTYCFTVRKIFIYV